MLIFFSIICKKVGKKWEYLILSLYLHPYFPVWFLAQTWSCLSRNQGHSIALLALRMRQALVPMLVQLIKTINMILASSNTVLPAQHFLDLLFNIHWFAVAEGTESFTKCLLLGMVKIYFDPHVVCTFLNLVHFWAVLFLLFISLPT